MGEFIRSTSQQVLCLWLCLYGCDFVMSGCLRIRSLHEICYRVFPVIDSSCSGATQTKRRVALPTHPPPSLPPFSDTNIGPPWAIDAALIH